MAEKKLRFAIFGNGSKALESIQIWEMLDYLIKHSAEVYVEQSFYYALQHQLKDDLEVDGLFEGSDFNADYVISLGGANTHHWCEYGAIGIPCKRCSCRRHIHAGQYLCRAI